MSRTSVPAKAFLALLVLLGAGVLVTELGHWQSENPARFFLYLLLSVLFSSLKISLPAFPGTMSVTSVFVLLGLIDFTLPETLLMGCTAIAVQSMLDARGRANPSEVMFDTANLAVAIAVSNSVFQAIWLDSPSTTPLLPLAAAAFVLFAMNTLPAAAVAGLKKGKSLGALWHECTFWALPHYLLGAGLAAAISTFNHLLGWKAGLVALPFAYYVYRNSQGYLERLKAEKADAEEVTDLHLRTIESLALAIDAKYDTANDYLRRMQTYAVEIGKEVGLSGAELQALETAALLHDIGILAVPEQIVSKTGHLTREEFEKVKIHSVVGAEILERVRFPYPVAPIVRAHHEKWNGEGYPDGLKGSQIPLGARILAVVDCLVALTSERPYRKAVSLKQSLSFIVSQAGISFDPRIVKVLQKRYAGNGEFKVDEGGRYQDSGALSFITAARRETQAVFELTNDLGNSLSLNETFSVLAACLKPVVPFDCLAIYFQKDDRLVPEFAQGESYPLFFSLEIPLGKGISGLVARNGKPILNGDPALELGEAGDTRKATAMHSALSIPLSGAIGTIGVLTLYRTDSDAFRQDDLRVLLAIGSKLALVIENAIKYRKLADTASTDFLTGLPHARSLFLHLDAELSRCRRMGGTLAVLVCDLDGFKQVNDRHGHLEGNKVLCAVSRALQDNCREYDYVARMGGDEFVMVLPGLQEEAIKSRITSLCAAAEAAARGVCPETYVSLSVGQARYPQDGDDTEKLLAEADQAMYKEKQKRRMYLLDLGPRGYDFDWVGTSIQ
jgi:diguanylate cyclase (GGDEF)-like protein/putative nucleotidyltransferase with HDIG domain